MLNVFKKKHWIDAFVPNVAFSYPLKRSEYFLIVFRGYRDITLGTNELIYLIMCELKTNSKHNSNFYILSNI